ncbi:hypothetical protein PNEG_00974 [Pneumocystis murina B123]|uniref:GPI inositol-deacylase n=1 Tax=Pneumocystis murina (strain B123) TaxID=1069680 RepID=M7NQ51_PNEMU|nr:hypothetical protein PNEG_00974 [Pneumocystis murina B123]EMR10828.1 hypothetical protein PNEG_00974 [Pneumocystis murina B123]
MSVQKKNKKKQLRKLSYRNMVIFSNKMFLLQLWIFRKICVKYRKKYSISLGIMMIAGFSIVMLIMMSYSFIYLQKDHSTCVIPAMYPSYIRLSGFDKKYIKHGRKYGLYLYKERKTLNVHDFEGIPVLFIPGNAGSYKQVRSLASEAAYQFSVSKLDPSLAEHDSKNLDFFSVDFNNDYTAFHGQTLLDQVEYSNEAVKYILSLYQEAQKRRNNTYGYIPKSVIVIGHSMGGIVIRAMVMMPNYLSGSINTIITLSTPHLLPPILSDRKMKSIYDSVNKFWLQSYFHKNESNPLHAVSLISITGGNLDTMVSSDYCDVSSLIPKSHGFTVFSSSIPMVWTGMDHQAILWCDQLRKVIVKSLFEIIDFKSINQTKPLSSRIDIFKKYYLSPTENSAKKQFLQAPLINPFSGGNIRYTVFSLKKIYILKSFRTISSKSTHVYFLPIFPNNIFNFTTLSLLTDQKTISRNGEQQIDIFLCKNDPSSIKDSNIHKKSMKIDLKTLKCKYSEENIVYLPSKNGLSNSYNHFFTYLEYSNNQFNDYQFISIINKSNNTRNGFLVAEFSNKNVIRVQPEITTTKFLWNRFRIVLDANRSLVSEISIPNIDNSLFTYKLKMNSLACDNLIFSPIIRQYISNSYESKYFVNTTKIDVNFHGTAPFMPPINENNARRGLNIQFWLDPTCNKPLNILISLDLYGTFGKLIVKFWTALIVFMYVIIFLCLRKQFRIYNNYGIFINIRNALKLFMRDTFLTLSIMTSFLFLCLSIFQFSRTINMDDLLNQQLKKKLWVKDTWKLWNINKLFFGYRDSLFLFLGPLFITISLGFTIIFTQITYFLISFIAILCNLLQKRFIKIRYRKKRHFFCSFNFSLKFKQRLIAILSLLSLVAVMVPYQFAYLLACVIQFFTCIKTYLNIQKMGLEKALHYKNFRNYVYSVLILMLLHLPFNIPVLIVWAKKISTNWIIPFSSHHNIFSVLPIITLVEFLANEKMIMQAEPKMAKALDIILLIFSVFLTVYGFYYTYFLHHLVNILSFFLSILHFMPFLPFFQQFIHSFMQQKKLTYY